MQHMEERTEKGETVKDLDLRGMNAQWQHPWHLSHRINLHEKLKTVATAEDGVGSPARLHTSSRIVSVDAEKGQVSLADGTTVAGDVILGADGIYVSDVLIQISSSLTANLLPSLVKVEGCHQGDQVVWVWQGCFPLFNTSTSRSRRSSHEAPRGEGKHPGDLVWRRSQDRHVPVQRQQIAQLQLHTP